MMLPKVLVGCPTYEGYAYCLDAYAQRVQELTYSNYDVLIADNSEGNSYAHMLEERGLSVVRSPPLENVRDRIVTARNMLREYMLEKNYDYFLSLEQDVIPPRDIIERLLRHDKQAVTGVYYKEFHVSYMHEGKQVKTVTKVLPLIYTTVKGLEDTDKMNMCSVKDVDGDNFFQIRGAGLGCMLLHKDVLEKISFTFGEDVGSYDDMCLSNDLYKLKIPMYVDTSVKCKHLLKGKER